MSKRMWTGLAALVASAWMMSSVPNAAAEVAAAPPAPTIALGKGETLVQAADNPDFKNPVEFGGVQLALVQTAKQPKGKVAGELRAIKDGKSTVVTKWQVAAAEDHYVLLHVRDGKAAIQYGHAMNFKTKDKGSDTYVELVAKNGKVTAGKKWSGNRLAKQPEWVSAVNPPL